MNNLLPLILTASIQCSVTSPDGIGEYSRFYDLTYGETGVTEEGFTTAEARDLSNAQGSEAWACLVESAEKNYCGAVALLEGCYRDGWQYSPFQCSKDEDNLQKYLELRNEVCPN